MPNVTSNPKRDTLDGTQRKTRRGSRVKRGRNDRLNRHSVVTLNGRTALTFRTNGTHEVLVDPGFPFEPHAVEFPTVTDIVTSVEHRKGPGKRHLRAFLKAPAVWLGRIHCTPKWATEIVGESEEEKEAKRKSQNLRIKDHVVGRKNIHSVDAPIAVFADRAAEVVPSTGWTLAPNSKKQKAITLTRIGRTKYHNATCIVVNGKWRKAFTIRRVRTVSEAKVALKTIHGIE